MIIYDAEPLEVSILKKHLANLTCKCSVCKKGYESGSCKDESKESNKEIQAGPLINVGRDFQNDSLFTHNVDLLCNQVSCPGCFIALNLLKIREPKIFKDEETDTEPGFACCDKSSGKSVKFVEKTTSTSSVCNPVKTSIISLREKVTNTSALSGIMKKRSNEHVTFLDNLDNDIPKQEIQAFYGECLCLQNFINSIRPPLN